MNPEWLLVLHAAEQYIPHRHLSNIDCLSFVVLPLLAPLIIGFFSFFFAAAIYGTNEANKAGGMSH
jgi:hypothetical protein